MKGFQRWLVTWHTEFRGRETIYTFGPYATLDSAAYHAAQEWVAAQWHGCTTIVELAP